MLFSLEYSRMRVLLRTFHELEEGGKKVQKAVFQGAKSQNEHTFPLCGDIVLCTVGSFNVF